MVFHFEASISAHRLDLGSKSQQILTLARARSIWDFQPLGAKTRAILPCPRAVKVTDRDFPLDSCNGKTKIPLALMHRFKSAGIPAMRVVVLLIVRLWYGSDSPRGI
jgi:hypothetical protein